MGGPSVFQIGHATVRRDLRAALLRAAVPTETKAGNGFGSTLFRATTALYALLLEHAVDRHGRCCACRRPDSRLGPRRRRCRIYPVAHYWLHQPRTLLATSMRRETGVPVPRRGSTRADRPALSITERALIRPTEERRGS